MQLSSGQAQKQLLAHKLQDYDYCYHDYLCKNQEDHLGTWLIWVNRPFSRRPIRHFTVR